MKSQSLHAPPHGSASRALQEDEVIALYRSLLNAWDRRDARAFASLFAEDGHVIGFDGSPMDGRGEIEPQLEQIFASHPTATYIGIVRGVRFPAPEVGVLFAVAGMVPPGQTDLVAERNAIQTLVAVRHEGRLQIVSFQNTPAAFHGRPEMAQALTEELRAALRARPA